MSSPSARARRSIEFSNYIEHVHAVNEINECAQHVLRRDVIYDTSHALAFIDLPPITILSLAPNEEEDNEEDEEEEEDDEDEDDKEDDDDDVIGTGKEINCQSQEHMERIGRMNSEKKE